MKSARQYAFEILLKIHRDSAYSNIILDSVLDDAQLSDPRDAAFVSNIVYGTLERMISIDYTLSLYLTQPIKKLRPELLVILRMGVYQLLFMDKVPNSAAVNESVVLAKNNKSAFAASLVNAVLRKVSVNGFILPDESDRLKYYEVKYSCPQWMLKLWSDSYGEENAIRIAESSLLPSRVSIVVNALKTSPAELKRSLEEKNITVIESGIDDRVLYLEKCGRIETLDEYNNGLFYVQDPACFLCCKALNAQPGDTVFDVCSAPGGKSFTSAVMMNNCGVINSFDIYQSRVELIRKGARRLGFDCIKPYLSDASVYNENYGVADKVLCDVPCSGLGIIGRKPEIRFKTQEEISDLPELQFNILVNSRRYLKTGGTLVYSTCTLNPRENEDVCNRFLSECREFSKGEFLPEYNRVNPDCGYLTLMPHINNTDGFFIAAFKKEY